jgi:hypothetical protein
VKIGLLAFSKKAEVLAWYTPLDYASLPPFIFGTQMNTEKSMGTLMNTEKHR